jgi:hypothetical protein
MRDYTGILMFTIFGIVVVGLVWESSRNQDALDKTEGTLRDVSRELAATKKALQTCEAKPPETEQVYVSSDKCGEFLARCMEMVNQHMEMVNQHIENVEAILR